MQDFTAPIFHKTIKNHKPKVTNAGAINNTPLQNILKLKVGARIILTYNLNTSDGLTNGALGEVIGYDISPVGRIRKIYVHFFDEKVGKERRKLFLHLLERFPEKLATPIEKLEFTFSASKKAYSASVSATALQFPL